MQPATTPPDGLADTQPAIALLQLAVVTIVLSMVVQS